MNESSQERKVYKDFIATLQQAKLSINLIIAPAQINEYIEPEKIEGYPYALKVAHVMWNMAHLLLNVANVYAPADEKTFLKKMAFGVELAKNILSLKNNLGLFENIESNEFSSKEIFCIPHIIDETTYKLGILYANFLRQLKNCEGSDDFFSAMINPWKDRLTAAPMELPKHLKTYFNVCVENKAPNLLALIECIPIDENFRTLYTELRAIYDQTVAQEHESSSDTDDDASYTSCSLPPTTFFKPIINDKPRAQSPLLIDPWIAIHNKYSVILEQYLSDRAKQYKLFDLFENWIALVCFKLGFPYETQRNVVEQYINELKNISSQREVHQVITQLDEGINTFIYTQTLKKYLLDFKADLQHFIINASQTFYPESLCV